MKILGYDMPRAELADQEVDIESGQGLAALAMTSMGTGASSASSAGVEKVPLLTERSTTNSDRDGDQDDKEPGV